MDDFALDWKALDTQFAIESESYFAWEREQLLPMAQDGLLTLADDRLQVTAAGRLLIRNICMVFDKYLRDTEEQRFSRVI